MKRKYKKVDTSKMSQKQMAQYRRRLAYVRAYTRKRRAQERGHSQIENSDMNATQIERLAILSQELVETRNKESLLIKEIRELTGTPRRTRIGANREKAA